MDMFKLLFVLSLIFVAHAKTRSAVLREWKSAKDQAILEWQGPKLKGHTTPRDKQTMHLLNIASDKVLRGFNDQKQKAIRDWDRKIEELSEGPKYLTDKAVEMWDIRKRAMSASTARRNDQIKEWELAQNLAADEWDRASRFLRWTTAHKDKKNTEFSDEIDKALNQFNFEKDQAMHKWIAKIDELSAGTEPLTHEEDNNWDTLKDAMSVSSADELDEALKKWTTSIERASPEYLSPEYLSIDELSKPPTKKKIYQSQKKKDIKESQTNKKENTSNYKVKPRKRFGLSLFTDYFNIFG